MRLAKCTQYPETESMRLAPYTQHPWTRILDICKWIILVGSSPASIIKSIYFKIQQVSPHVSNCICHHMVSPSIPNCIHRYRLRWDPLHLEINRPGAGNRQTSETSFYCCYNFFLVISQAVSLVYIWDGFSQTREFFTSAYDSMVYPAL